MLKASHKTALWSIFDKSEQTINELETAMNEMTSPWRLSLRAGIGTLWGNLYMSVERILRLFIENVYDEKIGKDEAWHKKLIQAGYAKNLLPFGIDETLHGMRGFRHLLTHGYGVEMDEEELRKNIPDAINAYKKVVQHLLCLFPELGRNENDQWIF
jgi:uncharacterized protein YutE (UPF0331/DUF86 family)